MILTQCSFIFHRRMGGSAASKHFGKYNLGKKTPIYHDGARQVIKKRSSKLTKGINFHEVAKRKRTIRTSSNCKLTGMIFKLLVTYQLK